MSVEKCAVGHGKVLQVTPLAQQCEKKAHYGSNFSSPCVNWRQVGGSASAHKNQSGIALAVSLVLLLAMTIIGVATLSGTRLSEKAASNMEQKAVTFHVAESAIESVWNPALLKETAVSGVGVLSDDSQAVEFERNLTGIESDYDLRTSGGGLDLDGIVTAQFCGETGVLEGSLNADESSTRLVGMLIDVTGRVAIENTNTVTTNVRRGILTSIATGRTSNCVAP